MYEWKLMPQQDISDRSYPFRLDAAAKQLELP